MSRKYQPSEEDPTGGEWAQYKVMEIYLNMAHPLAEPKWARGNLRDNFDPASVFQHVIHFNNNDAFPTVVPVEEESENRTRSRR